MSDEEEDYMSESVLKSCGDVRPGLYKSSGESYKRRQEKKNEESLKNKMKPLKVLEAEKRDEALNKSLDSNNKGFTLLQKMGYKPGTALGLSGQGRKEPINIEVKANRSGLGQEAEKRKREQQRQLLLEQQYQKRLKAAQEIQSSFRQNKILEQKTRRIEKNLRESQKVCANLDASQNLPDPIRPYFWPENMVEADNTEESDSNGDENDGDDDESLPEVADQLAELTQYLRSTYFYCIWCGHSFDDLESLTSECPGPTSEDHDE